MTIEIVDFPINSMVIFHRFLYVYQRVSIDFFRNGLQVPDISNRAASTAPSFRPPVQDDFRKSIQRRPEGAYTTIQMGYV